MFKRIQNVKIFEPQNPEYQLVDSLTAENFEAFSPKMLIWVLDLTQTEKNRDEIDRVYGENSSIDRTKGIGRNVFDGPIEFFGHVEVNEIIQELLRAGLEQLEDVEIFVNISDFAKRLGGLSPKAGDIIRVSYILNPAVENKGIATFRHIFYEIANITPVDLYNFRYVNFHIHAEQTNMSNVPDAIKFYDNIEPTPEWQQQYRPWDEKPAEVPKKEDDFNY